MGHIYSDSGKIMELNQHKKFRTIEEEWQFKTNQAEQEK